MLAQVHKDIFNARNDLQHKESRKLIQKYGTIFAEDLPIRGLAQAMPAKSVQDASWSSFPNKLSYRAEHAGRRFVRVNPRGTSQRCPCGAEHPKKLTDREPVCMERGLATTRDHASALKIQRLGRSLEAPTMREEARVAGEAPALQAGECVTPSYSRGSRWAAIGFACR
jgi:putative transposase